jgi:hypothetical protein
MLRAETTGRVVSCTRIVVSSSCSVLDTSVFVSSSYNNTVSIKSGGSCGGVYLKFAVNNGSLGVTSATLSVILHCKFSVFGDRCCKDDKDFLSSCEFVGWPWLT